MKLKNVKERIDQFFDNISAEELYEMAVLKYGFSEVSFDLENLEFKTAVVSHYESLEKKTVFSDDVDDAISNLTIAA